MLAIDIFVYCFTKFQLGHTSPLATFHDGVGLARLRRQQESNGMGLILQVLRVSFKHPSLGKGPLRGQFSGGRGVATRWHLAGVEKRLLHLNLGAGVNQEGI